MPKMLEGQEMRIWFGLLHEALVATLAHAQGSERSDL